MPEKNDKELKEKINEIIDRHGDAINNNILLPVLIDALVSGGIECFDMMRDIFEKAGMDLKKADFTRLR